MPRVFTVHTPLSPETLVFRSLTGLEQMSRLFTFQLAMLSPSHDVAVDSILGKNVTVEVETQGQGKRYLNGEVTRFSLTGRVGRYYQYDAVVRPWLWYLTRASDCKIYQHMTVPQILDEVFGKYPFVVDKRLTASYRTWDYCVQYQETDFNFVSRLMEHEGIFYYFEHSMGQHKLVLGDSVGANSTLPGYARIPFIPPDAATIADEEHIDSWVVAKEVNPGGYVTDDYDFTKPSAELQLRKIKPFEHPNGAYRIYEFPGGYTEIGDGEGYTKVRLEELQAPHEILQGRSTARGIAPGYLFNLYRCPRADQNREYLILSANYFFKDNPYEARGEEGTLYQFTVTTQDSSVPFRPQRITPKPLTNGPQTAVVVGPAGEEIYTDKYGRVKVQFHWDRYGKKDENSSCWIRVSHPWAGSNYGAMQIPRIGQEVIVDHINGDPDYPIITGRVYNAEQMPPWNLPANKTQSGILTRSSMKGAYQNANMIRFEDKKGEEVFHCHAQRDLVTVVERHETRSIWDSRYVYIENDHVEHVKRNVDLHIGGKQEILVDKKKLETVGGDNHFHVKGSRKEKVDGKTSLTVGTNQHEKVGMNHALEAGMEIHLKAGMKVILEAGLQLTIKAAGGFIDIGPAGITIQGVMVRINSGGAAGTGSGSSPDAPDDAKPKDPDKYSKTSH